MLKRYLIKNASNVYCVTLRVRFSCVDRLNDAQLKIYYIEQYSKVTKQLLFGMNFHLCSKMFSDFNNLTILKN